MVAKSFSLKILSENSYGTYFIGEVASKNYISVLKCFCFQNNFLEKIVCLVILMDKLFVNENLSKIIIPLKNRSSTFLWLQNDFLKNNFPQKMILGEILSKNYFSFDFFSIIFVENVTVAK